MGSAPKYSIVLPVFNGEQTLAEALDSVLAQTLGEFELIVIDDCSTDGTASVLDRYRDPRMRIIKQNQNLKLVAALNRGVDEARGEWIVRMDADDRMLPSRLMVLSQWCRVFPEVDVFGGNAWKIDGTGKRVGSLSRDPGSGPGGQLQMEDLWEPSPLIHPTVAIRASVAREFRYDSQALHCEDYELWLRMARAGKKLMQRPERVLEYRVGSTSVSNRFREEQLRSSFTVFRRYFPKVEIDLETFLSLLGNGQGTVSIRKRMEILRAIRGETRIRVTEILRQCRRAWRRGAPTQ